ncbi:MAG: PRC-barrel domain-containing protein [Planctomycetia bacterium]|nr:PRC-barrel domain-containing protein [Planctomycetia bacterium]
MRSHMRLAVMIGLCVSLGACRAFAQQAAPVHPKATNVQASPFFRVSTMTGMAVKNRQGQPIGSVEDMLVDIHDGQVRYVIMSFGGFLGVGNKLFPIPWHQLTLKYDEKETFFVADVSRQFLEKAPSFHRQDWPDMTSEWVSAVESLFPTHAGIVVGVTSDHLTMTNLNGSGQHAHVVATDAEITRDGQAVRLKDLQKGDHVKVTTAEQAGIRVATKIEATSAAAEQGARVEEATTRTR